MKTTYLCFSQVTAVQSLLGLTVTDTIKTFKEIAASGAVTMSKITCAGTAPAADAQTVPKRMTGATLHREQLAQNRRPSPGTEQYAVFQQLLDMGFAQNLVLQALRVTGNVGLTDLSGSAGNEVFSWLSAQVRILSVSALQRAGDMELSFLAGIACVRFKIG